MNSDILSGKQSYLNPVPSDLALQQATCSIYGVFCCRTDKVEDSTLSKFSSAQKKALSTKFEKKTIAEGTQTSQRFTKLSESTYNVGDTGGHKSPRHSRHQTYQISMD